MDTVDGETLNHLLLDNAAQLLFQKRRQNVEHFRNELDEIIEKYSQEFDGDEIDIFAMDVVDDRGHLRNMQHELDPVARHERDGSDDDASTSLVPSVEQTINVEQDTGGWESDESLDELSAQFYTTPVKQKRLSPAQSNKENQRPVLVDVTEASNSNAASVDIASPSSSVPAPTTSIPESKPGLNLNTDTISAVQAFLAMGKQLETLLQAAVQPLASKSTDQTVDTTDEIHRPQKRRRAEIAVQIEAGPSDHSKESRPMRRHASPGASNDEQGLVSDTTTDKRRRANTPGNCSIWQPSASENLYHKPKSNFFKSQTRKAYTRRQPTATSVSRLRNEVLSEGVDTDEPASGSDSTFFATGETLPATNYAGRSCDPRVPLPTRRTQSTQDKLNGIFKRGRGRPAIQFTAQEDSLLLELCAKRTTWKEIMAQIPGKSAHQLSYHHKMHLLPRTMDEDGQSSADDGGSLHFEVEEDAINILPLDDADQDAPNQLSPPRSLPNLKSKRRPLKSHPMSSPTTLAKTARQRQIATIQRRSQLRRSADARDANFEAAVDGNQSSDEESEQTTIVLEPDSANQSRYAPRKAMATETATFVARGLPSKVRVGVQEPTHSASGAHSSIDQLKIAVQPLEQTPTTSSMRMDATIAPELSSLGDIPEAEYSLESESRSRASDIALNGKAIGSSPGDEMAKGTATSSTSSSRTRTRMHPSRNEASAATGPKALKATPASGKVRSKKRTALSPTSASSRRKERSSERRISQFMAGNSDGDLTSDDDVILIRSSPSQAILPMKDLIKTES